MPDLEIRLNLITEHARWQIHPKHANALNRMKNDVNITPAWVLWRAPI